MQLYLEGGDSNNRLPYRWKRGVSFHSSLQMICVTFCLIFQIPNAWPLKSSGNVRERPKSPPPIRHKLTQTCQHAVQKDHVPNTAWKVMVGLLVGFLPLGPITWRIFEASFLDRFQFLKKLLENHVAVWSPRIILTPKMLMLRILKHH